MEQPSAVLEQQEDQRNLFERLKSSQVGQYVTKAAIVAAGALPIAAPAAAHGETVPVDVNNEPAAAKTFAGAETTGAADVQLEKAGTTHEITDIENSAIIRVGHSRKNVKSAASATYIGNFRTVAAAKIRVAKEEGKCKVYSAKQAIKAGIKTQGYQGTGVGFAQENRRTTACDTNSDGEPDTRGECGNRIIVTHQPRPAKARAKLS